MSRRIQNMSHLAIVLFAVIPLLCSAEQRLLLPRAGELSPRQNGSGLCDYGDGQTCSECYGQGYVLCSYVGCYNPDIHQQCCGDASLCVAANNSCCDPGVGPGVSGKDGTPVSVAPTPLPTDEGGKTFSCTETDTGEECCQRGGPDEHWCSGKFPNYMCYVATKGQYCCSNGVVCDGKDCCALISAKPTTPYSAIKTGANTPASGGPTGGLLAGPTSAGSLEGSLTAAASATTATKSGDAAAATVGVVGKPVAVGLLLLQVAGAAIL